MAKSGAKRQQERRERLKAQGRREVTVTLDAKALEVISQLQKEGKTMNDLVNTALHRLPDLKKPDVVKSDNGPEKHKKQTEKEKKARVQAERQLVKAETEKIREERLRAEALYKLKEKRVKITEFVTDSDGVMRAVTGNGERPEEEGGCYK